MQDLRVEERYCKASLWNSLKGEEQNLDEDKFKCDFVNEVLLNDLWREFWL